MKNVEIEMTSYRDLRGNMLGWCSHRNGVGMGWDGMRWKPLFLSQHLLPSHHHTIPIPFQWEYHPNILPHKALKFSIIISIFTTCRFPSSTPIQFLTQCNKLSCKTQPLFLSHHQLPSHTPSPNFLALAPYHTISHNCSRPSNTP